MKLQWLQQYYVTAKSRKRDEAEERNQKRHRDEWSKEGSDFCPPLKLVIETEQGGIKKEQIQGSDCSNRIKDIVVISPERGAHHLQVTPDEIDQNIATNEADRRRHDAIVKPRPGYNVGEFLRAKIGTCVTGNLWGRPPEPPEPPDRGMLQAKVVTSHHLNDAVRSITVTEYDEEEETKSKGGGRSLTVVKREGDDKDSPVTATGDRGSTMEKVGTSRELGKISLSLATVLCDRAEVEEKRGKNDQEPGERRRDGWEPPLETPERAVTVAEAVQHPRDLGICLGDAACDREERKMKEVCADCLPGNVDPIALTLDQAQFMVSNTDPFEIIIMSKHDIGNAVRPIFAYVCDYRVAVVPSY